MRTHYEPWQPCWISNQHQKHKSGRGPSSEYFWQVWLKSVQRFQRRRFKCEKLTDGWTDDGRLPMIKKKTWPMARWAKNNYLTLRSKVKVPQRSLRYATHCLMVMHPHTKYHWPIRKDKKVMVRTSFAEKKQKKKKKKRRWEKRKKKSD